MQLSGEIVRYIGIDFGTSTSVLCYKDYLAGQDLSPGVQTPAIDLHNLTQPQHLIPSVIHRSVQGETTFGALAERSGLRQPEGLRREFKMDLVSRDADARHQAQRDMEDFFRFLFSRYQATLEYDRNYRLFEQHTCVSYPSKWPDEARISTLNAAAKAGFPNVRGVDEPSAAMRYFMSTDTAEMLDLQRLGIIKAGKPLNILLLDMGAGTTDLVLYRYIPEGLEHEVLATWPPVDSPGTFGGREVDRLLYAFLLQKLSGPSPHKLARVLDQQVLEIRRWKEMLSGTLSVQDSSDDLPSFLDLLGALDGVQVGDLAQLDREWLGGLLRAYLPTLPGLINDLLDEARRRGVINGLGDIDLVMLTGGHSQWYFVKEILQGQWVPGLPGSARKGSGVRLDKIQREPARVVVMPAPQEAVARGLAYTGRPLVIHKRAANNAWFELTVSLSEPRPLPIVQMGERLPIQKRQVYYRIPAHYQIADTIDLTWSPLFGASLDSVIYFDPTHEQLQVSGLTERLLVWIGQRLIGDIRDTADVFLEVSIDDSEHLTAIGLLKGGDLFDDICFFAINRRPPTRPEQVALARAYRERLVQQRLEAGQPERRHNGRKA